MNMVFHYLSATCRISIVVGWFLVSPITAVNAAQCQVDGVWYDYNHPKCGGSGVPSQQSLHAQEAEVVRKREASLRQYDPNLDPYSPINQLKYKQEEEERKRRFNEAERIKHQVRELHDEANQILNKALKELSSSKRKHLMEISEAKRREADALMGLRSSSAMTQSERDAAAVRELEHKVEDLEHDIRFLKFR